MERVTTEEAAKLLKAKNKLTPAQQNYLLLYEKENAEASLMMPTELLIRVMDAPNGFYVKRVFDKGSFIYHVVFDHMSQSRVIWFDINYYGVDNEFMPDLCTGQNGVWPHEYGKEWAFTREELEDDATKKTMEEIDAKQEAKRNDPITKFREEIAHLTDDEASKMLRQFKNERKAVEKAIKHNNLKYLGALSGKYGDVVQEIKDLRSQYNLLTRKIELLKKYY